MNPSDTQALPLAYNQARFWLLAKVDPTVPILHIGTRLRWDGPLDRQIFDKCLNLAIERHPALRATFPEGSDGRPRQVIHDRVRVTPLEVRFDGRSAESEEVDAYIRKELDRPFDLQSGPLIRAAIITIAADKHIIIVTIHHALCDDWGRRVFIRDVLSSYQAHGRITNSTSPLQSMPYEKFIYWQADWLKSDEGRSHLEYWKNRLKDLPENPLLSSDYPRPRFLESEYRTRHFRIGDDILENVRRFGRVEGFTPFVLFLGIYQLLLHLCARKEDVLVGITVANRDRVGVAELVGFLANVVVIRSKFSGEMSAIDALRSVREATLEALEFGNVPTHLVLEELRRGKSRNLSFNPVFQSSFTFFNYPSSLSMSMEMKDARVHGEVIPWRGGADDLDMTLEQQGGVLYGHLNYKARLFREETIEKLTKTFEEIVSRVVQSPDATLEELRDAL